MDDVILIFAVLLLSASQVLQKVGATRNLSGSLSIGAWTRALSSPPLLLAILFIVCGTLLWLYVLYRMDLSRAYPFLGLGTIMVVAMSRVWLDEYVSWTRWTGVALISVGIVLVAQS